MVARTLQPSLMVLPLPTRHSLCTKIIFFGVLSNNLITPATTILCNLTLREEGTCLKTSWPKVIVKKWLNMKSGIDDFQSNYNAKACFQRLRKSCSDDGHYVTMTYPPTRFGLSFCILNNALWH